MSNVRRIARVFKSQYTIEGAGVRLKRAFGYYQVPNLDPFLLLDDFHSNNPDEYIAGFPSHPHRGIETVTYMLQGCVEHEDSLGNKGLIKSGDAQWMTAGSGIIHSEMPQKQKEELRGFQLWINLPASHKMMIPKYREVKKEHIPEIMVDKGICIRILCGQVENIRGPVQDIVVESQFLDVTIPKKSKFQFPVKNNFTLFAYVLSGTGYFDPEKKRLINEDHLIIYTLGSDITITTLDIPLHILLVSGKPLNEPIAWQGPIVMNTQEELLVAFEEYRNGTFIKSK